MRSTKVDQINVKNCYTPAMDLPFKTAIFLYFSAPLTARLDTSRGPLVPSSSLQFWLWTLRKATYWRPLAETCTLQCGLVFFVMKKNIEQRLFALQPEWTLFCNDAFFWCCRFYLPHGITTDKENNYWVTDVALHQVSILTWVLKVFSSKRTRPETKA